MFRSAAGQILVRCPSLWCQSRRKKQIRPCFSASQISLGSNLCKKKCNAIFSPSELRSPLSKLRSLDYFNTPLSRRWRASDSSLCSQFKLKRFHSNLAGRLAFCPSTPKSAGKNTIVSNRIFNTGTLLLALCNGNYNHVMTNNGDFLQQLSNFRRIKVSLRLGEGSKFEFTSCRGSKTPPWGRLGLFGADNGKIYRRRSVACHKIKNDAALLHNPVQG